MRIVASDEARALIAERGGRLYVSIERRGCCRSVARLTTATAAAAANPAAWRLAEGGGFELYLPSGLARLPEELHLEARRFPRRVEAYWNGCAWVV